MDEVLTALGHWPGAVWLQRHYVAYLVVNAAHILAFAPLLSRAAAVGLGGAVLTGVWLFTVKPLEYLANPAFLWKLGIFACALVNIGLQHAAPGYRAALAGAVAGTRVRAHALASLVLWLAVLLAGRWIGFL